MKNKRKLTDEERIWLLPIIMFVIGLLGVIFGRTNELILAISVGTIFFSIITLVIVFIITKDERRKVLNK